MRTFSSQGVRYRCFAAFLSLKIYRERSATPWIWVGSDGKAAVSRFLVLPRVVVGRFAEPMISRLVDQVKFSQMGGMQARSRKR